MLRAYGETPTGVCLGRLQEGSYHVGSLYISISNAPACPHTHRRNPRDMHRHRWTTWAPQVGRIIAQTLKDRSNGNYFHTFGVQVVTSQAPAGAVCQLQERGCEANAPNMPHASYKPLVASEPNGPSS